MGLTTTPSSPQKLRLKYTYERETRLMGISTEIPYATLVTRLRELTGGINKEGQLRLAYTDPDGDLITIRCDEDLREYIDFYCSAKNVTALKLAVSYQETPQGQLPPLAAASPVAPPPAKQQCSDLPLLPPITPTKLQLLTLDQLEECQKALRQHQQSIEEAVTKLRAAHPIIPPEDSGDEQQEKTGKRKRRFQWARGKFLGSGANSKVYIGMNQHTAELFAAKQIVAMDRNTTSYKDLEREINVMKSLKHPNIVRYLGAEKRGKYFNIFMECVSGGSIQSLLQVFGTFHEKVIRLYTKQILQGLAYLHANGVIHRDIKGGNILVDNQGVAKLADFGCSKRWAEDSADDRNVLKGTTLWMAPEVVRGNAYSMGSDLWSVACTIIEMATGKPPWTEMGFHNELQALYHIGRSNMHPRIPPHLSIGAADFLSLCFAPSAPERPSCVELLAHMWLLDDLAASTTSSPRPPYNLDESVSTHDNSDFQSSMLTRTTNSSMRSISNSVVIANLRSELSRHSSAPHFSPPRSARTPPATMRASPLASGRLFESSPKIKPEALTFEAENRRRLISSSNRRRSTASTHSLSDDELGVSTRTVLTQAVSDSEDCPQMASRSVSRFASPVCDAMEEWLPGHTKPESPSPQPEGCHGLDESIRTERSVTAANSLAPSRAVSPYLDVQPATKAPVRKRAPVPSAQRARVCMVPGVSRRLQQLAQPSPVHSPVRRTRKGKTVEFLSISLDVTSSKP
eukprot:TRINITY_DN17482_c0_g1_i1.p1 TRINITY_DN17482_c0_g1~~TRINITY_DN17482_c0_g1_i1.p1  ORF type:complete len:751 (-),score=93.26 TRINITY_DN17482_c0_g1_i1:59-2284(-)